MVQIYVILTQDRLIITHRTFYFVSHNSSAQTGKKRSRYRHAADLGCGQQSLKPRLYTTPVVKLITF